MSLVPVRAIYIKTLKEVPQSYERIPEKTDKVSGFNKI